MVGQTLGSNHTTFHSSFEQFNIIVPSNTDTIKFFIVIFTQICHTVQFNQLSQKLAQQEK